MIIFDLGKKIRQIRKERGFSQNELAKTAGVSRATLSKLENGHISKISVSTLELILASLGYTLDIKPKNPFVKNVYP